MKAYWKYGFFVILMLCQGCTVDSVALEGAQKVCEKNGGIAYIYGTLIDSPNKTGCKNGAIFDGSVVERNMKATP